MFRVSLEGSIQPPAPCYFPVIYRDGLHPKGVAHAGDVAHSAARGVSADRDQLHRKTVVAPSKVVVPAQAGTHMPAAVVYGTMGPRFRGDNSAARNSHT